MHIRSERKNSKIPRAILNFLLRKPSGVAYWRCTARVESRKRKPKAEKREGPSQHYQPLPYSPRNRVCKTDSYCTCTAGDKVQAKRREQKQFRGSFMCSTELSM